MSTDLSRWGFRNVVLPFGLAGLAFLLVLILTAFRMPVIGDYPYLAMVGIFFAYAAYTLYSAFTANS